MSNPEKVDLVVIGAGWFGLAAAKTFHEINPSESLAVLESAPTLGGVWARHRLYPGLKTNNMLGQYEYPDFPMDPATFRVQPGQHIPGHVCHEYLSRYADKFGIADKIRYETKVLSAEHLETGGWSLRVDSASGDQRETMELHAHKLVVATGLTSEPFLPSIDGQESFGAPLFHGKDFLQHADTLENATTKRATVFGGTKTGWDVVYAYATRGIEVDWVIRESGHGPAWMAPPFVTPLKKQLEKLVHMRLLTWFSPCIWGAADGFDRIRNFWHGTAVGRAITDAFWWILGNDVVALNKFDSHPETAKLKPWSLPMFTASSFSILNYDDDFFNLVRSGKVKVHIADITHLSPHAVHLSDGKRLQSDTLCCVTGWKQVPPLKFLPEGIDEELGIPHRPSRTGENQYFTHKLVERADREILDRFPRLRDQPVQNAKFAPLLATPGISTCDAVNPSTELTPYRLYHFIVPASPSLLRHRDVAFAGMLMNFSTTVVAHLQALWINAYFRRELAGLPDDMWTQAERREAMRYETVLFARFGKWRYPAGHGAQFPDFVFDALPYLDLLSRDLGLPVYRKGGGVWAEALTPYAPGDYANVVAEWRAKTEAEKASKEALP